jgi:L-Ala-D/L-Glu epimerase
MTVAADIYSGPIRIENLALAEIALINRRPFRVSTHATAAYRAILCRVDMNGGSGFGSGGHCRLTGETEDGILAALKGSEPQLAGREFKDREELLKFIAGILSSHPSAAAALDMAVWDWDSRRRALPLFELLAKENETRPRASVETDMSIGLESMEDTLRLAGEHRQNGFKKLKIKVGHPLPEQETIIRALRRAVGDEIELMADANQAYSVEEAVRLSKMLKDTNFLLLEQPIAREDLRGLGEVTKKSPLPVFADEAARTPEQIETIGKGKLASGIVLKLYKHGGITPTLNALKLARKHGLDLMIGCYSDTSLSIAAALHIALAFPEIKHIDLDSHLLAEEDLLKVIATEKNRLKPLGTGLGADTILQSLF